MKKTHLKEKFKLETSEKRIIGLTLETRPDYINLRQIRRLRRFNVTRLQIGVQHIDDEILQEINRGCYVSKILSMVIIFGSEMVVRLIEILCLIYLGVQRKRHSNVFQKYLA